MSEERQHAGTSGRAPRVAKGIKSYDRSANRRQIALRPTVPVFNGVADRARDWGVSWNEAAIRLLEASLSPR